MNFTAHYLARLKRKILDSSGNSVDTIKYQEQDIALYYFPPSLTYDVIVVKAQKKTPVLRETKDIEELKDYGFVIASIPVNKSIRYYKKQMTHLFISKMGQMPIGAMTVTNFDSKAKHRLVFDDANKLVKLVGPNAGPMGEGPWIQLEE